MRALVQGSLSIALVASPLVAQDGPRAAGENVVRVVVRDTAGVPVAFAFVQPKGRIGRTASDSGVAAFALEPRDSMEFIVRRLGFEPFVGSIARMDGSYEVRLAPLVQSLRAARIVASTNEILERRGFYDRMERARLGAYTSRFIGPEELDLRNPGRISTVLGDAPFVKLKMDRGRTMVLGRSMNCQVAVLLDGHRVSGMIEEYFTDDGRAEIDRLSRTHRGQAVDMFLKARMSIDELVTANSIAAIEMYASLAAAPPELQRNAQPEACGLIALWTGARR